VGGIIVAINEHSRRARSIDRGISRGFRKRNPQGVFQGPFGRVLVSGEHYVSRPLAIIFPISGRRANRNSSRAASETPLHNVTCGSDGEHWFVPAHCLLFTSSLLIVFISPA